MCKRTRRRCAGELELARHGRLILLLAILLARWSIGVHLVACRFVLSLDVTVLLLAVDPLEQALAGLSVAEECRVDGRLVAELLLTLRTQ